MYEYDDIEKADNTLEEESTSPVETVDQTKAFAARLKEEKAKAKAEAREELAKSFGYESWEEYSEAQTNNQLLDRGLDPESVRPVLQDLIKNDPTYIEAMKYKEEKEALEKELFATNSIKALNDKFGTNYKSVNELDEQTIIDWNKGTPLEKAFAANNYDMLISNAVRNAGAVRDNGKSHMRTVTGSNSQGATREVSKGELDVAKMFGFTEEQLKAYVNRTNK
jgi:hypothetical protein